MNCTKCGKFFKGNGITLHLKHSPTCSLVTSSERAQQSSMSDVTTILSDIIPESNDALLEESYVSVESRKLLHYQDSLHRFYCTTIDGIHSMQLNTKVKTSTGTFKEGDRRIYLDILLFVSQRVKLSEADCTALLSLLKKITSTAYGVDNEIALPSR